MQIQDLISVLVKKEKRQQRLKFQKLYIKHPFSTEVVQNIILIVPAIVLLDQGLLLKSSFHTEWGQLP